MKAANQNNWNVADWDNKNSIAPPSSDDRTDRWIKSGTGIVATPASSMIRYRVSPTIQYEVWLQERTRAAALMLRNCTEINIRRHGGKPVLRGTRFTLAQVLAEIADGRSVQQLAESFDLNVEHIREFLHGLAIHLDRSYFK